MENQQALTNEVIKVCLLAGKIMLQGGAETHRVEDTMSRIAASYGITSSHSFVTPTGIFFSVDEEESTKLIRIIERSTDLQKVTLVNSISRKISNGELTVKESYDQLKEIDQAELAYPLWFQIVAAFLTSGCFLIMYDGLWSDFLIACIAGGIGFAAFHFLHELLEVKFFAEFIAAFLIGTFTIFIVSVGIGSEVDKIIIGSVMPLVPGLLITNAVRDLIVGHFVSGLSKGAEASLTSIAMGAGIAVAFIIF
jgi:uncharacterized membrane protein YjjP (DUF1212 family)